MGLRIFITAVVVTVLHGPASCGLLRKKHSLKVPGFTGGGADPCFEAQMQRDIIVENAAREKLLYRIFRGVTSDCATGRYSLTCVQTLEYEENPEEFLRSCQIRMGHEHMNIFATCEYAQIKEAHLKKASQAWGSLEWIIHQAVDHCEKVPYECVALIAHCLDAKSIRFCFNQCLRTGNMNARVGDPSIKYHGQLGR